MANPSIFLQGPIPGQSLTDTPKNHKWERPPQFSDPEEVALQYISKLADQDTMDDLAVLLDSGVPLKPIVETLTTVGVSEGIHSIDVSLIVGPVIHAFIKAAMTSYGVEVVDEPFNPKKDATEREKSRLQTAIKMAMLKAEESGSTAESDKGVALLQQMDTQLSGGATEAPEPAVDDNMEAPMEEAPVEETPVEPSKGLMAREVL